jgi:hypothetical protein
LASVLGRLFDIPCQVCSQPVHRSEYTLIRNKTQANVYGALRQAAEHSVHHSEPRGNIPMEGITAWFALRFKQNESGEEAKH